MSKLDDILSYPTASSILANDYFLIQRSATQLYKVPNSLVVNGLQPTIQVPTNTIMGRYTAGLGGYQSLTLAGDLEISGSTLTTNLGFLHSLPANSILGNPTGSVSANPSSFLIGNGLLLNAGAMEVNPYLTLTELTVGTLVVESLSSNTFNFSGALNLSGVTASGGISAANITATSGTFTNLVAPAATGSTPGLVAVGAYLAINSGTLSIPVNGNNQVLALNGSGKVANSFLTFGTTTNTIADGGALTTETARALTAEATKFTISNNLAELTNASAARVNLGLGSVAQQSASSIVLTGGSINGVGIGGLTPAAGKFSTLAAVSLDATPIGTITPAAANFTTLGTSGVLTANSISTGPVSFGSIYGTSITDLSKHISLYGNNYGFNATASALNHIVPTGKLHQFVVGSQVVASIDNNGIENTQIGFTSPASAQFTSLTVTGLLTFTGTLTIPTVSIAGGTIANTTINSSTINSPSFTGTPTGNISATTVTSTGSTTPQTLANIRGRFAYLYDYGATGNGTTDDSAAYNAALATGKPIIMEPGSYHFGPVLTGNPGLTIGYGAITLPHYGLVGNQTFWQGNSGMYIAQTFTQSQQQTNLFIAANFAQPAGTGGESSAAYIGVVDLNGNVDTVGLNIQASAGAGVTNSALCAINSYVIYSTGTNGHGSAQEVDINNSTGTDDPWPINNTYAKGGVLYVNQGTNKATFFNRFSSDGTPVQAGLVFDLNATAQYDLVGAGTGLGNTATNRWSIDTTGNAIFKSYTGDASPATVKVSGSAATARTLSALFGDIPNLLNNGIVANGTTDVSIPMYNFITSLSGNNGSVFAPSGKYLVSYGPNIITHAPGLISFGATWPDELPPYFGATDGTQLGYNVAGVSQYGHAFGVFRNLDDIYGQSVAIVQGTDTVNSGTISYQKSGLYVNVSSQAVSSYPTYTKDIVAVTGYGNINGGNTQGRTWGGNLVATVASGSDGLATGLEVDLVNNSTYQPLLAQINSKAALTIYNLGSARGTAGVIIGDGFNYGLVFFQPSSNMTYCWAINSSTNFPAYLDYQGNIKAASFINGGTGTNWTVGIGSPTAAAPIGSIYSNTFSSTSPLYVNTTGLTSGWTAVINAGTFASTTFNISTTGATTPLSLSTLFGQQPNALFFGAKGNGTFDNTTTFNNFYANSGAAYFVVPAGDYLLSSTVYINAGSITAWLPGAYITGGSVEGLNDASVLGSSYALTGVTQPNIKSPYVISLQSVNFDNTSSLSNSENGVLYINFLQDANSGSYTKDGAAIEVHASLGLGVAQGRLWGTDYSVTVPSSSDGYVQVIEAAIINNGGAQSAINQVNSKNVFDIISSGTSLLTSAILIRADNTGGFQSGIIGQAAAFAGHFISLRNVVAGNTEANDIAYIDNLGNVMANSIIIGSATGPKDLAGSGVPAIVAPIGSTYRNTTGGAGTSFYINNTGLSGGWSPVALLASPAFTGVPTAPTAAPGTNTIQLATTAFVSAAITAAGSYNAASVAITGGTIAGVTISSTIINTSTINTPTINTPAISGGTITGAAISNGTISNATISNPALTNGTVSSAAISGGTINNTVIGNTTAAAGTFTSLNTGGVATLYNSSATTNSSVLIVRGPTNTLNLTSSLGTYSYTTLSQAGDFGIINGTASSTTNVITIGNWSPNGNGIRLVGTGAVYTAVNTLDDGSGNLTAGSVSSPTGTFANLTASSYFNINANVAISAAGTTQGTATTLTGSCNVITTVAANSGVILPAVSGNARIQIANRGANVLSVYPPSGQHIENLATNAASGMATNSDNTFIYAGGNLWYRVS